jgi:DDE superfamily endonuclease
MMPLWLRWFEALALLSPAFSRKAAFHWFCTLVAGFSVRSDQLGVTSVVRGLKLRPDFYDNLLDACHSTAVKLERLTQLWVQAVLTLFPEPVMVNGMLVLLADGLKIPKRGRLMPGVKLLKQQSGGNTKPDYIMGHSIQAASLLVKAAKTFFPVHLVARIHEGIVLSPSPRSRRTLLDKMISMLSGINLKRPFYLVADAYYAAYKVIDGLLAGGNHLITRMKKNAVAYVPHEQKGPRKRGRPKKYGKKIKLNSLFENPAGMLEAPSPVYGENDSEAESKGKDKDRQRKPIMIRYRSLDLLWRPAGRIVRFVAVLHPVRGFCLLMCTDLSLPPLEVIRLYGLRFKIEFGFKQSVRTLGIFSYHFWMRGMKPLKPRNGNQYLHRDPENYRDAVMRKLRAYHVFIQAGIVCQGLLQYLSLCFTAQVWGTFGSWLRTIRHGIPPSELVVTHAMRNTLPEFLVATANTNIFTKFLTERQESCRMGHLGLAA